MAADDVLAIAVSGGPDSMALLALAHAAWPGQVIAATVDHGLRAAAAHEAAMVAAFCATLRGAAVPHATLRSAEPLGTCNLQANARDLRYRLLADWAIAGDATMLATAHHADDQAETFLMRAARGSGLAGLSGIRPNRDLAGIPVIRPLLGWRRGELRDIVVADAIPFVDDPSNGDERYDRTRFRALLAANDWLDPHHLARTAAYARECHDALDAMVGWLWKERQAIPPGTEHPGCQTWLDLAGLPREIRRRMARAAVGSVRTENGIRHPAFSPASNIEPLLDAVEAGSSATQGGILVSRSGDVWHFREAPPRRGVPAAHS